MTITPPQVSVLMPVYNVAAYLLGCLDCFDKQSFRDFEVIAVNDGSTDESPRILEEYAASHPWLKVIHKPNGGVANALNFGLGHCRAELIARMDADDECSHERLALQTKALADNPGLAMVGSWMTSRSKYSETLWKYPVSNEEIRAKVLFNTPFSHPTVLIRKACLPIERGPYNIDAVACEDYDLWAEMIQSHQAINLPVPLLRYRLHDSQVSTRLKRQQRANAAKVRRRLLGVIGLPAPEGERTAHELLSNQDLRANREELALANEHIGALIKANKGSGWTAPLVLGQMLYSQWIDSCATADMPTLPLLRTFIKGRRPMIGIAQMRTKTVLRILQFRLLELPQRLKLEANLQRT